MRPGPLWPILPLPAPLLAYRHRGRDDDQDLCCSSQICQSLWIGYAQAAGALFHPGLTGFAEREGPKGSKSRTVTLKRQPIFAWGGLWRKAPNGGLSTQGAMTDCNEAIRRP